MMREKLTQEEIRALLAQQPLTDICCALFAYYMARQQFHDPENPLSTFKGLARLAREMARHMNATQRIQVSEIFLDVARRWFFLARAWASLPPSSTLRL
jgi:hypothetical protein